MGAASHVYPLGDVVIKIPFDRPDAIEAVTVDAAVTPYVRALDVHASELIAFDDALDIVPVPFAIFRKVEGAVALDSSARSGDARATWHEVGRQLARVHAVTDTSAVPVELRSLRQTPEVDPRPWVGELRESGRLSPGDARWLLSLLDRIAPDALAEEPFALCHGDVNTANVLVDARTGRFRALIDWAGAGWLDPAWDFAGVALDVVPWLLTGHREVAPLPGDVTAEARICWCQAQTRLYSARSASSEAQPPIDIGQIRRFARHVGMSP